MTNEEFDEILERTNAVVCDREWYERAVKALEQGPCENCSVKHELEVNVKKWANAYKRGLEDGRKEQEPMLDKIRAEIEKLQKMCDKNDLNLLAQYSAFGMVLDIIDKYKAESEDNNGRVYR